MKGLAACFTRQLSVHVCFSACVMSRVAASKLMLENKKFEESRSPGLGVPITATLFDTDNPTVVI